MGIHKLMGHSIDGDKGSEFFGVSQLVQVCLLVDNMDDDDVEVVVAILTMFGLIAAPFAEMNDTILILSQGFLLLRSHISTGHRSGRTYSVKSKISRQLDNMHYLINDNDVTCRDHICMNSDYFNRLCYLLQNLGGLRPTRNVSISEQVAIFLTILSHHTKNRVVKHTFRRSGYTISKYFNNVLNTLLRLYTVLLSTPTPVPEDSTDNLNALKELVVKGHKCDNGFKTGYLMLLENMLAKKFPGTKLKGDPHINNKIHVWKKQYACLKTMLGNSGIGLNSTTYRIDVMPEVWEAHLKVIQNLSPSTM
ncbi:hypothetical protein ACS0TY_000089 [Phlomoides rotata]